MNHPASGYVQAINDFAAPILLCYLIDAVMTQEQLENVGEEQKNKVPNKDSHLHSTGAITNIQRNELCEEQVKTLGLEGILEVEADIFWCLSKLIDDMQDNYTN